MTRPDDDKPDGGFLTRWSRRKQEIKQQEIAPAPQAVEQAPAPVETIGVVKEDPPPPLPSLDDIVPGSDVAAFFGRHVPETLRKAALRKLWVTDPEIKGFIEMAENQWDFNNPDSIPGWSSKLTGVDVKAMAERLFNAVETVKDDETEAAVAAESAPEAIRETTESEAIPATSAEAGTIVEAPLTDDCAVQNNPSESSVYDVSRKRNGGALPT